MIEVTNIRVRPLAYDRQELRWEIEDTHEEVHDYLIHIHRSESKGGPWNLLVSNIEDRYLFVDTMVDTRNRWRKYYYKLVLEHKASSEEKEYDPVCLAAPVDLIAAEAQRREHMYFRKLVGRKVLTFPRRTFGQRCHCWDPAMGSDLMEKCLNCYGTGYLRGYLNPMVVWMQMDPSTKANQMLPDAETQQVQTVARTSGLYPEFKPKDILVEAENRRWRVVTVTATERLRAILRQEMRLSEIRQSAIEFELPVDFSVLDPAADGRNFKRRATL